MLLIFLDAMLRIADVCVETCPLDWEVQGATGVFGGRGEGHGGRVDETHAAHRRGLTRSVVRRATAWIAAERRRSCSRYGLPSTRSSRGQRMR